MEARKKKVTQTKTNLGLRERVKAKAEAKAKEWKIEVESLRKVITNPNFDIYLYLFKKTWLDKTFPIA